jgi:fluoride exporter
MMKLFLVGAGGFLGSITRYLLSNFVQESSHTRFPVGTLLVNVLGCLVIGLLSQIGESRDIFSAETRAFIFVGILGGFTTYSSFGNETINLWRNNDNGFALLNVALQLTLGLGAVWMGRMIGSKF